jgi:hypothetical protein
MREICTYGSVRGAAGNGGPYRDKMMMSECGDWSPLLDFWMSCAASPDGQRDFQKS